MADRTPKQEILPPETMLAPWRALSIPVRVVFGVSGIFLFGIFTWAISTFFQGRGVGVLTTRIFLGVAWVSASLLWFGFARFAGYSRWVRIGSIGTVLLLVGAFAMDRAYPMPKSMEELAKEEASKLPRQRDVYVQLPENTVAKDTVDVKVLHEAPKLGAPVSSDEFTNMPAAILDERTKKAINDLDQLYSTCAVNGNETDHAARDNTENQKRPDGNGGFRFLNEQEKEKILKGYGARKAADLSNLRQRSETAVAMAYKLRSEIVHHNRISPQYGNDNRYDALFSRLKASTYSCEDASEARDHLKELRQWLESANN